MNGGRIFVDWWAVIVILILVVVGNSAIAETSAGSAQSQSTYVALGDSYSSGEGNPGLQPAPWLNTSGLASTANDGCDRSAESYPALVDTWLNLMNQNLMPRSEQSRQ